jgi:hypothetical protein
MVLVCKNCGSRDLEYQGHLVTGPNRKAEWAKNLLEDKMYRCRRCKRVYCYYKEEQGESNDDRKIENKAREMGKNSEEK